MENKYNFDLFDNSQYVIGEKIGEGSYGVVYKVIDLNTLNKELYALKILKPGYSKKYMDNLIKYSTNVAENDDTLYRGYRGRRSILHKYKIIYLDNVFLPEGEIATGYATLSELASLGNLNQYLKEHKCLSYNERLEIVSSVLNGIQRLHCKSICHSALKAENILIFKRTVKEKSIRGRNKKEDLDIDISLSDFSVIPSFNERTLISPDEFYASYTSPSCIKFPNISYTFEDDIYSFGLFLWQIAYNEIPFQNEFKEINSLKLNKVISNSSYSQSSEKEGGYTPILPEENDTSKEIPYVYKKKIEERNKEVKLLESYNQIQQSTHYMDENYKLNFNKYEHHTQNDELLKLYNLIVENQLRPEIGNDIPLRYRDLIMECWDNQDSKRPDLAKIEDIIDRLKNSNYKEKMVSLDYKLSVRQSRSLSKCLNDSNSRSVHTNEPRKEKAKSIWNRFNPRESIMKFINKTTNNYTRSNLSKGDNLFDSPVNETSLLHDIEEQNEIEMDEIKVPEQIGYNNIPIGHCENNYTTINIESDNEAVIIEMNPPEVPSETYAGTSSDRRPSYTINGSYVPDISFSKSSNDANTSIITDTSYNDSKKPYDINSSYMTDTTHANNVSYISSGVGDSFMDRSGETAKNLGFYSKEEQENTLIYPELELDDIEDDDDIDNEIYEELEKMKNARKMNEISDPLNSKQVNQDNKNEILKELESRDFSGHLSNSNTSCTSSDDEESDNITNYHVAKNYINYTNNKRNTLFAFLESKTNNATLDDNLELSSSGEDLNFYDGEDAKQLQEKNRSTNSIKDNLRNAEMAKASVSSPITQEISIIDNSNYVFN